MSKFDFWLILIFIAAVLGLTVYCLDSFRIVFAIIIAILILGLFFYSKLKPLSEKGRLSQEFAAKFSYVEKVYDWIFKIFTFAPKLNIGPSLNLDTAQLIVAAILLIILIIL